MKSQPTKLHLSIQGGKQQMSLLQVDENHQKHIIG